jgi:hypothetical protein
MATLPARSGVDEDHPQGDRERHRRCHRDDARAPIAALLILGVTIALGQLLLLGAGWLGRPTRDRRGR